MAALDASRSARARAAALGMDEHAQYRRGAGGGFSFGRGLLAEVRWPWSVLSHANHALDDHEVRHERRLERRHGARAFAGMGFLVDTEGGAKHPIQQIADDRSLPVRDFKHLIGNGMHLHSIACWMAFVLGNIEQA